MLPDETMRTPPSSLDMDRRPSAASSGRKNLDESIRLRPGMTPALTGGDVDADWENAYFSGDEAPGGDNLTPDQEDVDDMGKALGVEYQDNEELQGSEKVVKRDAHTRRDRLPEVGDAHHRGILVGPGEGRLGRHPADVLRPVDVGEPLPEIYRAVLVGQARHDLEDGRRDAGEDGVGGLHRGPIAPSA